MYIRLMGKVSHEIFTERDRDDQNLDPALRSL